MANNITTNPLLWTLDSTGSVKAAGYRVHVIGIHYEPGAVSNALTIGDYAADGSTVQNRIMLKAHPSLVIPIDEIFPVPLVLNGVYVVTITAGTAYLMVLEVEPVITA